MRPKWGAAVVFRLLIALGLLFAATWLFVEPWSGEQDLRLRDAIPWLWFGLAGGLGFTLRNVWAFLLAPFPRLLSLWYNLRTGRSIFIAEGWPLIIAIVTTIGILGMALGWALYAGWERQRAERVL